MRCATAGGREYVCADAAAPHRYQQQLQQLQQQAFGQSSPLQLGAAYRIPDTSINLSGSYQNGKTNLQLSCVPDDSAAMLGPNGFTRGVGPGNLGLSVNVNI